MIDRHYGHLARDRRKHAIKLLDQFTGGGPDVHAVELDERAVALEENATLR